MLIQPTIAPRFYTPARAAATPQEPPVKQQTNFGGNRVWESHLYQPGTDAEVLEILERHKNGHVRPMGSKHSWSDVAVSDDVTLDMSRFNKVEVLQGEDGESFARIGGGARLQDICDTLHATSDQTMPTLGAIKRQTISGAISTGTHGSGRQSLSHYVTRVKVAAYDKTTGQPKIFEYTSGDELKAARCGLGCTGVILEVDMKTRPKYLVEEKVVHHKTLDDVLARYPDRPLTQFTMTPYRWDFTAWERQAVPNRELSLKEKVKAQLFRAYNTAGVDVMFHLLLKGSLMIGDSAVKNLMKLSPHLVVSNVERVDDAEKVLTLGHHYFRHEEMELFVPESKLKGATELIKAATEVFSGESKTVPPAVEKQLREAGTYDELMANHGTYTQHYPFFFRKVMPEDTLISMASSAREPYFSISVFTYNPPEDRGNYGKFCSFLARTLNDRTGARLHWGKHFPLGQTEMAQAYPNMDRFKEICQATDPNGVFRNQYTDRVLGLG